MPRKVTGRDCEIEKCTNRISDHPVNLGRDICTQCILKVKISRKSVVNRH